MKKVHYQQETGQVIYRSKMTHGRNKKNFEVSSALDFIAAIIQPDVIRKILVHLELWEEFTQRRSPPMPLAAEKVEVVSGCTKESFDDGWPGYDEPWVDVHSL